MISNRLPRGLWMQQEGREIFSENYDFLVSQGPARPLPDQMLDPIAVDISAGKQLIAIGNEIAHNQTDIQKSQFQASPLADRIDDILFYTGATDLMPEAATEAAICMNVNDTLSFAYTVVTGTALEVLHSTPLETAPLAEQYSALTALVRNPQFPDVLDTVAITGAGVIGNEAPTFHDTQQNLSRIKLRFGFPPDLSVVSALGNVTEPCDLSTAELVVDPAFRAALLTHLKQQNRARP